MKTDVILVRSKNPVRIARREQDNGRATNTDTSAIIPTRTTNPLISGRLTTR